MQSDELLSEACGSAPKILSRGQLALPCNRPEEILFERTVPVPFQGCFHDLSFPIDFVHIPQAMYPSVLKGFLPARHVHSSISFLLIKSLAEGSRSILAL